ncbi:dTDP-4-dehydrorhamnose 3,5-epimerase [Striga asiatica]|uniref:dTDP-4-dehydrorhamnose 3,5-epimerase n=1 Tax=Striga asiatica TaxID=4170 RepID=A0A5A7NXC0_STRAF|nr:dTDP-4-dehydrorhamnose 3,5-epimerase [Striga asiatica]
MVVADLVGGWRRRRTVATVSTNRLGSWRSPAVGGGGLLMEVVAAVGHRRGHGVNGSTSNSPIIQHKTSEISKIAHQTEEPVNLMDIETRLIPFTQDTSPLKADKGKGILKTWKRADKKEGRLHRQETNSEVPFQGKRSVSACLHLAPPPRMRSKHVPAVSGSALVAGWILLLSFVVLGDDDVVLGRAGGGVGGLMGTPAGGNVAVVRIGGFCRGRDLGLVSRVDGDLVLEGLVAVGVD